MTQSEELRTTGSIHPATLPGFLSITVANLPRALNFYTQNLGFAILEQDQDSATLGAGERPLLHLHEIVGAKRWPQRQPGYTGLYHFAILLPTQADLGRWIQHWLESGNQVPGQADHLVSEAFYLTDMDGNGIEIYRDRPRDQWQWSNGQVQMATDPINIRELLTSAQSEGKQWNGLPTATRLGHMHLQVGDIPQARTFYHDLLGFDIVAQMPSALFVSAGGYHHHLGLNTWQSKGAGPAPADMTGLRFFTLNMADQDALNAVLTRLQRSNHAFKQIDDGVMLQDPWQNTIFLHIGLETGRELPKNLSNIFTQR